MSRGSKALFAHRLLLGRALEARREMEGRDFISLTSTEPISNNTILYTERERETSKFLRLIGRLTILFLDQSRSHISPGLKLKPFPWKTLFMYGFHILKHRFTPWLCSLLLWQRYCFRLLFISSHFRGMNCPSLSPGSGREFIFVGQVFQNVISDRNHPTRWIQGQTLARLIFPSQNTQIQGLRHEDVHSSVGGGQKITTIKYWKAVGNYM